ncbi:hypothetical protein G5B88_01140 [Herbaspirillum seropedicae]|uniref:Holin of 3TMs, for gene-transfer release n=1 Tax=Herbaspirillum seropedicae (strain SmR1) TaxID=757424 RepID=D8IV37_HERSS|nr:holin family protein [Herbaspirillum seropedicae]ADJ61756.1 conserved hypothetical protein [Herbaspirillum seropedicae SmR1]AKN63953.1 hypothetical protein ACP92_01135 [Herbaspirillum seropedicae]NQE29330.1 hypothetical protein [Herbaspirillum seropedicae]UMU19868.1 hypothetical protein G5B88_01140 [Herbaspirillum seropedicae]
MSALLAAPLLELGRTLIGKLWPDPQAQADAQFRLLQLQQAGEFKELERQLQLMLAQSDVNREDARSGSNFRGGWRPFIGWVCGLGLAYQFLLRPLANGVLAVRGHGMPMPELDTNTLMALVTGMLGFGGLRTFEKQRGLG